MKAIMVAIFACVAACAIDEEQVSPPPADVPAEPSALQSQSPLDDRSTLETTTEDNLESSTASVNCVFVRYCDAPGSTGTVCVIRTGCGCPIVTQALNDECMADLQSLGCSVHQPLVWQCQ